MVAQASARQSSVRTLHSRPPGEMSVTPALHDRLSVMPAQIRPGPGLAGRAVQHSADRAAALPAGGALLTCEEPICHLSIDLYRRGRRGSLQSAPP